MTTAHPEKHDDRAWIETKTLAIELAVIMSQPQQPPAPVPPHAVELANEILLLLPPAPPRPPPPPVDARLLEVLGAEYQRLNGKPSDQWLSHRFLDLLAEGRKRNLSLER